jgi:hypothetical protein
MCLSKTDSSDPFCWKQAHLPSAGENVLRAMYHALILALVSAVEQGFSEVFVLCYNEILANQVCYSIGWRVRKSIAFKVEVN